MQLQENTLFANRYQLVQLLGRGGFSEVWLAKDNWTHLQIALKVYAPGQGMDANGLQEFCGELANVFDLNHSNLLKPTHVDTWNDMPYLIMAYCSQGSLTRKIGKIDEEQMWKMIHDVASGLSYLHDRDVVHQDIKPDNILVDEYGNYVITDFGISTRARSTLRKSVIGGTTSGGTTAYMGPERFSKQPAPTKASDIWSFGSMCYELLEGNVPFGELGGGLQKGGAEIPTINAQVSDALKYTIIKMLSKDTWDRPVAKTLLEWSSNPSMISIDYDLITEDDATISQTHPNQLTNNEHPNNHSVKETCAFPKECPEEENQHQEPQNYDKDKKPKHRIGVIFGIIGVMILLLGGSVIGICIGNKKQRLYNAHTYAEKDFDSKFNQASINNIDALDQAVTALYEIRWIESQSLYSGYNVYHKKCRDLQDKAQTIYDEANRKYQKAPSGTDTKKRNLQKRDRVASIKSRIVL